MTYYPIPDIPEKADPPWKRFVEQVRTAILRVDAYGQPLEVHQPFYSTTPDGESFPLWLEEFPVYRADRPMELLYATWTMNNTGSAQHDFVLRRGPGDAAADRSILQEIRSESVTATAWRAFEPKRFIEVTRNRLIPKGHILTLEIFGTSDGQDFEPTGLLSMYFRGAVR